MKEGRKEKEVRREKSFSSVKQEKELKKEKEPKKEKEAKKDWKDIMKGKSKGNSQLDKDTLKRLRNSANAGASM